MQEMWNTFGIPPGCPAVGVMNDTKGTADLAVLHTRAQHPDHLQNSSGLGISTLAEVCHQAVDIGVHPFASLQRPEGIRSGLSLEHDYSTRFHSF